MKTSRAVRVGFLALTLLVSISQIGVSVAHIVQVQGEPLASTVVEGTQARPNDLLTPAEAGSAKRTRGTPVSGFWNQTYGTGALAEVVSGPMARAASPPGGVPNAFSRNQYFGGPNYMTSVKNQGSCGSCWAFASIGGMEAQYQINKGNPSTGIDLSEQNVLQCSGGSCSGWYLGSTLDFLKNSGTPDEACNPYTASDHACGTGRCSDYLSRTYRVTVWSHISTDTANIKNYIYTQGPVMVWMPVFDDFPWYDAYFWQYYFYGHSPSGSYGGHFVVIVGWDDQGPGTGDDYWMVRNSWGTSGGDVNSGYGGYFYMTQDPTNGFFGIYQEAAIISGVAEPGPVTKTATVTLTETSTSYSYRTTTTTATSYTSTTTTTSTIPTVTTVALVPLTITSTAQSTQFLTSVLTTTVTSYTSTSTSTSTIPTLTTVALVPLTVTSIVQSIQYLTSLLTATVTSYTGTQTSTSTIVVPTTVTMEPSTSTSTVETTQVLTSTGTTRVTSYTTRTVTSYTGTETSTSTIPTVTTVALVPSTVTSTVQSTQYVTSVLTTTVTSYTGTTTSTSTSVVYTTVTEFQAGAGASNPLAYLGFISLLAVAVGDRVTAGNRWSIPKVRSRMERRCSRS